MPITHTPAKEDALRLIDELKEAYKDNKELALVLQGAKGTLDAASDETKIRRIISTLTMVKTNGGNLDGIAATSDSEDKKLESCRSTLATRLAQIKTDLKDGKTGPSPTAVDAFRYLMLIEEQRAAITTAKEEALRLIDELKETYKDNKELALVLQGAKGTLDAASDETKIRRIISTLTMVKTNGGNLDGIAATSDSEDKKLESCRSTLATRLAQIKTDLKDGKTGPSSTAVDAFRYLMLIEEQRAAITTVTHEADIKRRLSQVKDMACRGEVESPTETVRDSLISCYQAFADTRTSNKVWYADKVKEIQKVTAPSSAKPSQVILEFKTKDDLMEFVRANKDRLDKMVLYDKGKRFAEVRDGEIYDDALGGAIAESHEDHPHP